LRFFILSINNYFMKIIAIFLFTSIILFIGCKKNEDSNNLLPVLTTQAVSSVTNTSAVSGGSITDDGGSTITARGVVWDVNTNPVNSLNTKTSDGIGTGSFNSNVSVLQANTTYYLRAYATNGNGTSYGNEISFRTLSAFSFTPGPPVTDIDGNVYPTIITSCGQTWMQTNLKVSRYRNGVPLFNIQGNNWSSTPLGAWVWYNNDSATYSGYGKLYNWYATNYIVPVAPAGWHVPTNSDWNKLIKCIDPNADTSGSSYIYSYRAGGALKERGTTHWLAPNVTSVINAGFNGFGAGYRYNGLSVDFTELKTNSYWWSANEYDATYASNYQVLYYDSIIVRNDYRKSFGFSIRCVKD
jgi:uncharacterized protein (TIGR02145 family)